MPVNIFSTYSTGENRVTASILAVLQSLSLQRMERILQALTATDRNFVQFINQPSAGSEGVPDALIFASFRLVVETKIRPGMVQIAQLERHLRDLKADHHTERTKLLVVITPDDSIPKQCSNLRDQGEPVVWASFENLNQAINEILADTQESISEREVFLLRELQAMFRNDGLIAAEGDVVIVAARSAWPEYLKHHVYVCQPMRSFQAVSRMGFYSEGQIQASIPKIIGREESVEFRRGIHSGRVGDIVERMLDEGSREEGQFFKIVFLSSPESDETLQLSKPIINDLKVASGRTWAFTLSQRYTQVEKLKKANRTTDLID